MKTISTFFFAALIGIGSIYAQSNQEETLNNKINDITNQIKQNPDDHSLYVDRAEQVFLLRSMYPNANGSEFTLVSVITDMDKAIQLHPTAEYYALRGEYQRDVNMDLSAAIKDLTRAIELDPENPRWYIQRSNYKNVNDACNDIAKAAEYGSKVALEIDNGMCTPSYTPEEDVSMR